MRISSSYKIPLTLKSRKHPIGNAALDLEIQILDLYNNAKSKTGLRRSAAKTVRTLN